MRPLIGTESLLYKKRLVRELKTASDGFYASVATFNVRCNVARLKKGALQVHSFACSPEWFIPSNEIFTDPYGRQIVASRKGGVPAIS